MLGNLSDINSVGPNMAIALITTLYGSLLANWICIPISTKLKANDAVEIRMKEIIVEGLLSIQAGENPRIIEEKLKSFVAPDRRGNIGEKEEAGE
jgi:chemotaxis protein MotA